MRYLLLLYCVFAVFGTVPRAALAAFSNEVDLSGAAPGDIIMVTVRANTETQTINALESSVVFNSAVLEFTASDDSTSVISAWIKQPHLAATGTVHFSGITPGGFVADAATVLNLSFKILQPGNVVFSIEDPQLLLSDGQGTPLVTSGHSLTVELATPDAMTEAVDDEMPEDFTPEIISDPDLFEGKSVLIFSTRDTGSGIQYFEVKEGEFGEYTKTVSPYLIQNQALDTVLYVKAVDHFGNERVKELYPKNWKPWYKPPKVIAIALVPSVLLLLVGWVWYRRTRRR